MKSGRVRTKSGTTYKPSVVRRTESLLRLHILTSIGKAPAASITRRQVQALADELAATKSAETARKAIQALSVLMRMAERDGLIDGNPVDRISMPRDPLGESPVRVLAPADQHAILNAARADDERLARSFALPLFALAFGTGLRLGEILALRWGPFGEEDEGLDLDGQIVRVRWSLDRQRDRSTGEFPRVRPKSRAGVRDVPLAPSDVTVLRKHFLAGGSPDPGALVFSKDGRFLAANGAPRHTWRRVCEAAGVSGGPRIQHARHSWCVTMLRAGVRAEAIAKLGGWTDTSMIYRRYGKHVLPDELPAAALALESYRQQANGTT
jgi:integrase